MLEKSGQFTETIVKQNATISRLTSKLNETQLKFRDQIIGKDSIAADAENAKREADKFGRQYNEMMKKCQTITMKVNDLSSSFNSSPKRVSDLQPVLPSMTSRSTMQSTMRYNSLESFNDEQDTDDQMKRDLLSTNTDSSSA